MDELLNTEDAIMISSAAHDDVDLGAALPTNLYFTICDDLSNDSADFLAINTTSNLTTQIKQEPKLETPLQYRLVKSNANTTPISPTSLTLRAVSVDNANTRGLPVVGGASNLLPPGTTAVQLPSGCEIYLVKEYIDSDCSDMLISEECEELPITTTSLNRIGGHGVTINHNTTQTTSKLASVSLIPKAIKTEPDSQNQILNVISPKIEKTKTTIRAAAGQAASNYKKRDEKRRKTHNEVERRRRDKINSWIFKLKEMLPTESNTGTAALLKSKSNNKSMCNGIPNSLPATKATSTLSPSAQFDMIDQVQQPHTAQLQRNYSSSSSNGSNRSPPSDSKSQILIKACEYIKQMQDEIKSLRECLMENEKLRSSNHRLQNELNRLKSSERRRLLNERQQQQHHQSCNIDSGNIIDSSDDFTLTLCANNNGHLDDVATSTLFAANTPTSSITLIGGGGDRKAATISVPYTKRELIISDYVD